MNSILSKIPPGLIAPIAFLGAAALAFLAAFWAAVVIESRSAAMVTSQLLNAGYTWATVETDGLQVHISGTAPNEAARFRAINLAGSVIDAARVRDEIDVTPLRAIEAPRFSIEMLRNDDGIQLFGLLPAGGATGEEGRGVALAEEASALAAGMKVTDLLNTAAYPAPEGWNAAVDFGLEALRKLPRAKISVAADRVAITAITGSEAEKRKLEAELQAAKPEGLEVEINLTAPRPVLTPFTLRFLKDADGARFDACSADTERARDRIITAAGLAGAEGQIGCTIGMGVPSPRWAEAAEAAIRAINDLGAGSVTFSDADISLLADVSVPQATFDKVVGELQAALPPAFSLKATLPAKDQAVQQGPAEFTAVLADTGRVEMRGRLTDEVQRAAVAAFAQSKFGVTNIYNATRPDEGLPEGWSLRVMAGLAALDQLAVGNLLVRSDTVEVSGVTGSQDAKAKISQILSDQLGQGKPFKVSVTYDEKLDPLAALPTPDECMADINLALMKGKITFAPGSAEIDAGANPTLDALTKVLIRCPELALEIGAHSDSQGSEGGNKALSQARAEAVLLSLQGRRAPVGLLRAVGYGEERPIADNDTDEGREANRRIEFTPIGADGKAVNADQAALPAGEAVMPEPRAADDQAVPAAADAAEPAAGETAAPVAVVTDDAPSVAPAKMDVKPKARGDRKP